MYLEYANARREEWQREQKQVVEVNDELALSDSGDVDQTLQQTYDEKQTGSLSLSDFDQVLTNLAYMYWKVGNYKDCYRALEECLAVKEATSGMAEAM